MQGCLNQNNNLDKLHPQNIFSSSIKKAVIWILPCSCLTHPFQQLVQKHCRHNTVKAEQLFCHFSSLTTQLNLPWKLCLWKNRCLTEKLLPTEMNGIASQICGLLLGQKFNFQTFAKGSFIALPLLSGHKEACSVWVKAMPYDWQLPISLPFNLGCTMLEYDSCMYCCLRAVLSKWRSYVTIKWKNFFCAYSIPCTFYEPREINRRKVPKSYSALRMWRFPCL